MSNIIIGSCKEGSIAATDRRITLEDKIVSDSTKINKLYNYNSSYFMGSIAFIETGADSKNSISGKNPFLAVDIVDRLNHDFHISEKDGVIDIPEKLSFEGFYLRLCSYYNELAQKTKPEDLAHLPVFAYLVHDKTSLLQSRGIVNYNVQERTVHLYDFPLPIFSIGNGSDLANEYFKKLKVDFLSITLPELAFHISNAYMIARLDREVGGTFKMTKIAQNSDRPILVSRSRRCAMNTFSGAYVAGQITAESPSSEELLRKIESAHVVTKELSAAFIAGFSSVKPIKCSEMKDAILSYPTIIETYSRLLLEDKKSAKKAYSEVAKYTRQSMDAVKNRTPGMNYWLETLGEHRV